MQSASEEVIQNMIKNVPENECLFCHFGIGLCQTCELVGSFDS
jgi:hypothetical protein